MSTTIRGLTETSPRLTVTAVVHERVLVGDRHRSHARPESLGLTQGLVAVRIGQNDGESVTIEARHDIPDAIEGPGQEIRDPAQALVALRTAVGFVERSEGIDVRQDECERLLGPVHPSPLLLEAFVEAAPVQQPRKSVHRREAFDFILEPLDLPRVVF